MQLGEIAITWMWQVGGRYVRQKSSTFTCPIKTHTHTQHTQFLYKLGIVLGCMPNRTRWGCSKMGYFCFPIRYYFVTLHLEFMNPKGETTRK